MDAEDAEPEDVAEFLADHEGALEDQAERFGKCCCSNSVDKGIHHGWTEA